MTKTIVGNIMAISIRYSLSNLEALFLIARGFHTQDIEDVIYEFYKYTSYKFCHKMHLTFDQFDQTDLK